MHSDHRKGWLSWAWKLSSVGEVREYVFLRECGVEQDLLGLFLPERSRPPQFVELAALVCLRMKGELRAMEGNLLAQCRARVRLRKSQYLVSRAGFGFNSCTARYVYGVKIG